MFIAPPPTSGAFRRQLIRDVLVYKHFTPNGVKSRCALLAEAMNSHRAQQVEFSPPRGDMFIAPDALTHLRRPAGAGYFARFSSINISLLTE